MIWELFFGGKWKFYNSILSIDYGKIQKKNGKGMDRHRLLERIQKGEQNRYGEIEYALSDADRLSGLEQVLESTREFPLSATESKEIESIIYWNLCSNIGVVDATCKLVERFSHLPSVRNGFLEGLREKYNFRSRVRHLENIIYHFKKLNLSFSEELISDIKNIVSSFREKDEWDQNSTKVEDLMDQLK